LRQWEDHERYVACFVRASSRTNMDVHAGWVPLPVCWP
jgi:hypothetical protein